MDNRRATSQRASSAQPPARSPGHSRSPSRSSGANEKALKVLLDTQKQLEQRIEAVIAAGQTHDQRIMKLETDVKAMGDGMGTMGRHVQAMDDRLKIHIGGTVDDLNQAMLAIDVAFRKTVSALEFILEPFQLFDVLEPL